MDLLDLEKNWDEFAKRDPLWAIISWPDKKGNMWEIDQFFEYGVREIGQVMKYVESLGVNLERARALDFGCGVGRLTQALCGFFDEVDGVDIAPRMLELARKYNRHGAKCRYILNQVNNLSLFKDNSFDFVYSNITLQHMKPAYSKAYISEFVRILIPHGLLIFQLPCERVAAVSGRGEGNVVTDQAWRPRGITTRLKEVIKCVSPSILLELYRRSRTGNVRSSREPRMEMHVMSRNEVLRVLEDAGAWIVDIMQDQESGRGFISYRYTVTKGGRT